MSNQNQSFEFNGQTEINLRLERGQSFGLTKDQYGALAHVAMAALRWADVQPSEISFLSDTEPGAIVVLYGRVCQYSIVMNPNASKTELYALPLDSNLAEPGMLSYSHDWRDAPAWDFVGNTLGMILQSEGCQPVTELKSAEHYIAEAEAARAAARASRTL